MSFPSNLFMLEVPKAEHVHWMLSAAPRPPIGRHPALNIYSKILVNKTPRGVFYVEDKRHDWASQKGAHRPLSLGGLGYTTLRGRFSSARNSQAGLSVQSQINPGGMSGILSDMSTVGI